jgi:hypothetical protein
MACPDTQSGKLVFCDNPTQIYTLLSDTPFAFNETLRISCYSNDVSVSNFFGATGGFFGSCPSVATSTGTQSGTTVTGAGFTSAMIGGLLVFSTGTNTDNFSGRIVSVANSTTLTLSVSQTVSSPTTYHIHYGGTLLGNDAAASFSSLYFNGVTGDNLISLQDGLANALTISGGGTTYLSVNSSAHTITINNLALTTVLAPSSGGTGVNNGSSTITLGGNLTTSGANDVTFATTGSTSLTLPTTGTVISSPTASNIIVDGVESVGTTIAACSQSGRTITITNPSAGVSPLIVGSVFKFDNGVESPITAWVNATTLTTYNSATVVSQGAVAHTSSCMIGAGDPALSSGLGYCSSFGPYMGHIGLGFADGSNSYGFAVVPNTSSAGTISQSGTIVTGSSTFFTVNSHLAGGWFAPATGTPCRIISRDSATQLTVSVSQTIGAGTRYAVYYCGTTDSFLDALTPSSMRIGNINASDIYIGSSSSNSINLTGTLVLGTVLGASYGGTGVANSNTITLAGDLVTSGANSLTLTTTGSTNVTVPVSGTLLSSDTQNFLFGGNLTVYRSISATRTASQSGTTVTLVGDALAPELAIGATFVFANGVVAYIIGWLTLTTFTASVSQTVASQSVIYYYGAMIDGATSSISTYGSFIGHTGTPGSPSIGTAYKAITASEYAGTIAQSTTTVTGTGTNFSSDMIGGEFAPATGTPARITAVGGPTSMTVSVSQTIGAGALYNIYYMPSTVSILDTFNPSNMRIGNVKALDIYIGSSSSNSINLTGTLVLGTVLGASYGGTGVNNGSSTITLGGSLTLSGAFTTTLTATATTSVTLPTSGTLATTQGLPMTVVSGTSQSAAVNNAYISNNAGLCTITLPSTAAVGDTIQVGGLGAGGWKVAQNASQLIHIGSAVTTTGTGGSLASTNAGDTIAQIRCVVANTTWVCFGIQGNITVV